MISKSEARRTIHLLKGKVNFQAAQDAVKKERKLDVEIPAPEGIKESRWSAMKAAIRMLETEE